MSTATLDRPETASESIPPISSIQAKFLATRGEMDAALIERSEEIDIVLTALITGYKPLFVGPPGTAKSLLLDSLVDWISGKRFSVLFSKYSTPEEVFGPISVRGLKEDKYYRITTNKLPDADIAFFDEIFKASSAILNTLLRVMNEGVYENGDGTFKKVPLLLAVAASNEYPNDEQGGKELAALFDRFLLRKNVHPIRSAAGRKRLLQGSDEDHKPKLSTRITPAEIKAVREFTKKLPVSDDTWEAVDAIIREINKEGILPGDRRLKLSVGAARGFAVLNGASQVEPEHLEIMAHTLWEDPTEQPGIVSKVVARIANPVSMQVNGLLSEANELISTVDVRDVKSTSASVVKLNDVVKRLKAIKETPGTEARLKNAQKFLTDEIKRIRLASIESLS